MRRHTLLLFGLAALILVSIAIHDAAGCNRVRLVITQPGVRP